jgi:hypothetical protein
MLEKSAQAGQHSYADRGADCYETPPEAVQALLKVEKLPTWVWEPACGPGSIVRALEAAGHSVSASDLHDYGQPMSGFDFLTVKYPRCDANCNAINCIVTNPPYQLAQKFVEKALDLKIPLIIMLLRLAFLESERRTRILDYSGLARVHVFKNRLPMMHRKDWNGPKASSAIPFAWFVWERGYRGPTTIDRIAWE